MIRRNRKPSLLVKPRRKTVIQALFCSRKTQRPLLPHAMHTNSSYVSEKY
ncbi:hypothetical protein PUN28_013739 [Cardiocondyla obscurior]|uniref:Uncharacterized protein n=1 Tax=Cardiocondyla obscurior TaxID=286306 RepID=A0AAW2F7Z4_9HYME